MKRRHFCAAATVLGAGMASLPLAAQPGLPPAGTDYIRLEPAVAVDAPTGQIEVLAFFWYNCPHCNAFRPALDAWAAGLAPDVAFQNVPVAFSPSFVLQQRLFYALEQMGLLARLHDRVYAAIHVERKNLSSEQAIVDWVAEQGVAKDQFMSYFNAFGVNVKAQRASQQMNAYQVRGVPSIGVGGRFYTDATLTGSINRVLPVVDFLLAEIRAGR